ncbi:hypothetical protein GGR58DRAFT_374799 [Xylaria digitata]|nr:hypothetical protein GGR58DRAFT_374799 [Xylaria digitata]
MAIEPQQHNAVTCTENIAMLHLLHSIPSQPFSNPKSGIQTREAGYSLPFDEERSLATTIAFLSQIRHDTEHIPAVCLQEIPEEDSLKVLLAINRADTSIKGRHYASQIKSGFDGIAATLQGANDQSRNIERTVFRQIIALCKSRILYRMRFVKPRGRRTIIDDLQRIVDHLHKNPCKNVKEFLEMAKKAIRLAVSWKKHQTNPALEELVDAINSLRQTDNYEDILGSIPQRVVDVDHVINMTFKVSRYRESATVLFEAARKFPRVRNMGVDLAELPTDAFSRPTISSDYRPSMYSTISRCQNTKYSPKDVKRMCDLLKLSPEKASARYNDGVKDNLENSKVHAEIQLLYYCQTTINGKALLPRVICSSKSACWLCNSFILFHGKFHMPRCHGKLYPKWRLPNLHDDWCNETATSFNQHLEGLLAESLKILYIRKAKTEYRDPIESDLSTLKWPSAQSNSSELLDGVSSEKKLQQLNATVHEIPRSLEQITPSRQYEVIPEEETAVEGAALENHVTAEYHASASLISVEVSGIPAQDEQPDVAVCDNLESSGQIAKSSQDGIILEQEMSPKDAAVKDHTVSGDYSSASPVSTVVVSIPLDACASPEESSQESQKKARSYNITLGEISPVYSSGPLQLQFEYTSANWQQKGSGNSRKQLSCTTEWLSPKHAEQLKLEGVIAIDADSLMREEISHITDASNNIYLRLGEAVLRVTMDLCDDPNCGSPTRG